MISLLADLVILLGRLGIVNIDCIKLRRLGGLVSLQLVLVLLG